MTPALFTTVITQVRSIVFVQARIYYDHPIYATFVAEISGM
jgi:hypothetical protein